MSQAQTGLPAPWTVRYSKSKNLPYYYNPTTNASQWEPPAEANPDLLSTYMQKHFSSPQPVEPNPGHDKIRCAHLLVKHRESRRPSSWKENDIKRSKEEARQMIEEFESVIRSGQVELGELASKESDCSSARKKGDLGFFGRGEMQKEFEDAAFALEVGEMSGPVETASGVHLIVRLE